MKKLIFTTCMTIVVLLSHAQNKSILYNGNIVDVASGKIFCGYSVTINNGFIEKIEKTKKSKEKNDIDVTGKYLMPGLIDSHLHWANFADERPAMDSLCKAYISQGVTTIRDVGGDARIIKKYTDYLKTGDLIGPTAYYSSFWAGKNYFDLRGRDEDVHVAWNREINPGDDYEEAIKNAKECGCIGLKLYADLTKEQLTEIVKLCKKHGIYPWGHLATNDGNALEVVRSGVEVVSHIYYLQEMIKAQNINEEKASKELFDEMIKRGTILDPTLTISVENGMDYVIPHFTKAYKAGVRFVAGTDYIDISDSNSYKCFFLHELDLYVDKCGVTPSDAIKAATITGAEILGKKGTLGEIREGAEADILLLNSNPLESLKALREIDKIIIDGNIVIR